MATIRQTKVFGLLRNDVAYDYWTITTMVRTARRPLPMTLLGQFFSRDIDN
jgi:hypothetical protein